MIKYSRGRNIHRHWLYLLRETRTRIAPWTSGCVCAFSGIPSFLSSLLSFPFLSLQRLRHGNNKRWRRTTRCSVYYLVGWFFSRHRSLSLVSFSLATLHRSILACSSLFLLSSRFVDKRPRKGAGHPIGRKDASYFFFFVFFFFFFAFVSVLQVTECFFLFFSIERGGSTQYPLRVLHSDCR